MANIRQIDRGGLGFNVMLVFAPGLLEGAPQTATATIYAPAAAESAIERLINAKFPGATTIGVREALGRIDQLIDEIGLTVRLMAGIALAAGTLVLAGAMASGERRRIFDAVVLKVLGATRGRVLRTFLMEYGLLGLMAAIIAALLGMFASWAIVARVMDFQWSLDIWAVAGVAAIAATITLAFGIAGTWRALGPKGGAVAAERVENWLSDAPGCSN